MATLLILISLYFSFIFFIFSLSNSWIIFFWFTFSSQYFLNSLFSNLIIDSIIFIIFWLILFFLFKNSGNKKDYNIEELVDDNNSTINEFTSLETSKLLNKDNIKYNINKKNIILFISILFFIFIGFFIIFKLKLLYIFWLASFILYIIFYYIFTNIDFFTNRKSLIWWFSFILLYISIISAIFYFILQNFDILLFIILIFSIYINLKIHIKYENYISFSFAILSPIFLLYYLYFWYLSYLEYWWIFFSLFSVFIIFEYMLITYIYKFKYKYDYYYIWYIIVLLVIISLLYIILNFKFDFIGFSIILFIDFILVFFTYYKIKNISKLSLE